MSDHDTYFRELADGIDAEYAMTEITEQGDRRFELELQRDLARAEADQVLRIDRRTSEFRGYKLPPKPKKSRAKRA